VKVLFVCTANICRSPMAAEYARHRAAREGLSHLVVESRGLLGIEGSRASEEAVQVLREAGLDLSQHRSRGVRASDLKTSDRILVMALHHLEEIAHRFPGHESRTILLRAFEGGPKPSEGALDVEDPISCPVAFYRGTFEMIRVCVDHLMLHLKHTA
jgi:protein-tyrosine-phosphatase